MEEPKKTSGAGEDISTPMEDKETKPGEEPAVANSDGTERAPVRATEVTPEITPELAPETAPATAVSVEHVDDLTTNSPVVFVENVDDLAAGHPVVSPAVATSTPPIPPVELERVPIEAAFGAGWQQLKSHVLLLFAVSLLAAIVWAAPFVVYGVIKELVHRNYFLLACLSILAVMFPFLYNIGRIKVSLRLVRGEAFNSDDFVSVAPWLLFYLVMLWCRSTLTLLASCFFIIPGFIVHTRLDFAEFFIVDKHQNPFKAMASSWRITNNATMMLMLFSATRIFVEYLGLLALLIGGIPARWMSLCAQAFVYERLCQLFANGEISTSSELITVAPLSTNEVPSAGDTKNRSDILDEADYPDGATPLTTPSSTTDTLSAPVLNQSTNAD